MTTKSEQQKLRCHLCGRQLQAQLVHGRKSRKPFVMLVCPADGRHMRTFVGDAGYVGKVVERLENRR